MQYSCYWATVPNTIRGENGVKSCKKNIEHFWNACNLTKHTRLIYLYMHDLEVQNVQKTMVLNMGKLQHQQTIKYSVSRVESGDWLALANAVENHIFVAFRGRRPVAAYALSTKIKWTFHTRPPKMFWIIFGLSSAKL